MNVRALVAEVVGTFTLVLFGTLSIASVSRMVGEPDAVIAQFFVPWGFGLGLMAAIAFAGHASGGHFNPAVTLGAFLDGRVTWVSAIGYVVAQVIGAIAASLMLLLITSVTIVASTVTAPGPTLAGAGAQDLSAFAIETVLTAIFVATILTITVKLPHQAVIIIPIVLAGIHFAAIPLSGASVNPARSLAPAIVSGSYGSLWVYLTAPFVGGILGWALYKFLVSGEDEISVEIDDDYLEDQLAEDLGLDDDLSDDDEEDEVEEPDSEEARPSRSRRR